MRSWIMLPLIAVQALRQIKMCPERDALLQKARQAEAASQIEKQFAELAVPEMRPASVGGILT